MIHSALRLCYVMHHSEGAGVGLECGVVGRGVKTSLKVLGYWLLANQGGSLL